MGMNPVVAAMLLQSMLERLERQDGAPFASSLELAALRYGVSHLQGGLAEAQPASVSVVSIPPTAKVDESDEAELDTRDNLVVGKIASALVQGGDSQRPNESDDLNEVNLNVASLGRSAPELAGLTLCLDFGTAMSKACVAKGYGTPKELELGVAAGYQGFLLPSTLFISTDGRMYFGQEALDKENATGSTTHKRIDSIKSSISQWGSHTPDVDVAVLEPDVNPIASIRLTKGDAIRLYLAYFCDISSEALGMQEQCPEESARYVLRRYARPCWPNLEQQRVADAKMREMLEQAQILADTFRGEWFGGIALGRLKQGLDKVRELGARPSYLIDVGIPEPVAVASGVVYDIENARDAFMVVDAGAGTTDLGLFVMTKQGEEVTVHQVDKSIRGLMQAGDKVDALLRAVIADREGVDRGDAHGREVWDELTRRLRSLKETLFAKGELRYVLSDGTTGGLTKQEFLSDPRVVRFSQQIKDEFVRSLSDVDDTWLAWLARDPMRLKVVVTGGSSHLDMMQDLAKGVIDVRGFKIERQPLDVVPGWVSDSPELKVAYPQLAVAIGGVNPDIPLVKTAPGYLVR